MDRLVTRLLQLARIQSSPDTAETVEVAPFLAGIVARYGQQVRLDVSGTPAAITMNPDHLETAVRNLVDNALRHGAGQPVDVVVGHQGSRLAIAVRDRGPGISNGNQGRIFERFFTTERDRGGTGLGLSITKKFVEMHGGRIWVESELGKGSTFFFEIPLRVGEREPA